MKNTVALATVAMTSLAGCNAQGGSETWKLRGKTLAPGGEVV